MSELNPVRIAVIGAGAMGRNHIRFVTEEPEAELVAIADAFEGARATAEAAGVPVLVGQHRRHNPFVNKAKEIIESGELGKLTV